MSVRTVFELALVAVIVIQNRQRLFEWLGDGFMWAARKLGWAK